MNNEEIEAAISPLCYSLDGFKGITIKRSQFFSGDFGKEKEHIHVHIVIDWADEKTIKSTCTKGHETGLIKVLSEKIQEAKQDPIIQQLSSAANL